MEPAFTNTEPKDTSNGGGPTKANGDDTFGTETPLPLQPFPLAQRKQLRRVGSGERAHQAC
jgi:hypothetical protein